MKVKDKKWTQQVHRDCSRQRPGTYAEIVVVVTTDHREMTVACKLCLKTWDKSDLTGHPQDWADPSLIYPSNQITVPPKGQV